MKYILALDQGTSSSRAILFDQNQKAIAIEQQETISSYPKDGYVEQDPEQIWNSQLKVAQDLIKKNSIDPLDIKAIGITNQRETFVLWDNNTGQVLSPAIVWQDRRSSDLCHHYKKQGFEPLIISKTGLLLDPYFSGTKLQHFLQENPSLLELAHNENLSFGTIDTWLIYKLTNGAIHATDATNASRTLLYNIHTNQWDNQLLELFEVPKQILPIVKDSSSDFGMTSKALFGAQIPICGVAGDQQAALIGQSCFEPGLGKNTYGTGCFMLVNTGHIPLDSQHKLLTTIAYRLNGQTTYALEGSVFIAGAAIQWLRDKMKLIDQSHHSDFFAQDIPSSHGVYVIPAFVGLGAPYWDPYARGAILGISSDTTKAHIIRATLESIAFQSYEVLLAMQHDSQTPLIQLNVDGGASQNNYLMQFQADLLGIPLVRPAITELTALGAARLAGLYISMWKMEDLQSQSTDKITVFSPRKSQDKNIRKHFKGWQKAVSKTLNWLKDE